MQNSLAFPLILLFLGVCAGQPEPSAMQSSMAPAAPSSVVLNHEDFNSENLLAPEYRSNSEAGFSFLSPNRFSMHQSYSLSFASGSAGSLSSGVYLNTLSYHLAQPLTLSMDMGFYSPIYSTVPGMNNTLMSQGLGSSLIFPRFGLQYKPNDQFSLNLDFIKTQDALKAYGGSYAQPFWSPFP